MAQATTTPHATLYATGNRRFRALLDAIIATKLPAVVKHTGERLDVNLEESDALALFHAMRRVYAFDFGADFDWTSLK